MKTKTITSWSYSRYSDYKQCPFKAKLKHVDKLKEPPNEAMARGAQIHNLAEDYLKGKIKTLPKELKAFADEFKKLRKQYKKSINGMVVEDNWAFTKTWDETQWNNWTHCWVRIKLDCAHHEDDITLIITDWKTGKYREDQNDDYLEQLELYALAAFLLHDHIEIVKPRLVYLDVNTIYPPPEVTIEFTRKDIPALKKKWEKRVKPMLTDTIFAPKPNRFCNWCHFRKANAANGGGQCKF